MTNLASIDSQLLADVSGGESIAKNLACRVVGVFGGAEAEARCKQPWNAPEIQLPHVPSLPSFPKLPWS